MNNRDFLEKVVNETVNRLLKICETKGNEYSGNDDRGANFKRLAAELHLQPETVLWVYMKKHIDSVSSFVRRIEGLSVTGDTLTEIDKRLSEPMEGRLDDIIMYALLLKGLLHDRRNAEGASKGLVSKE